jgi:hypothetical protein
MADTTQKGRHMTTYDQWTNGEITDYEALRLLADDLSEIDEIYERARAAREERRNQISHIVAHIGDRAAANGYEFMITRAAKTVTYDAKALDDLVAELRAERNPVAARIAAARKVGERAGSLRVTRPQERKR